MKGTQLQRKAVWAVVSAVLLASMLALAFNPRIAQAIGTSLYVNPAENTVNKGEFITINIEIQGVTNLFSYETKLGYDKTILEPVTIEEGPFIQDQTTSPQGTLFLSSVEEGYVVVACMTLGNYPGVNGSGTLLSITFNVTKTGTSALHLYDSILLDSNIAEIPHDTADGTVLATIPGDVNLDGVVNVIDLTIVALSYGAFIGEPDYNPIADLNEDGIVDMKDLVIVAWNLGKS